MNALATGAERSSCVLAPGDAAWPTSLDDLGDPPATLHVRGELRAFAAPGIAIVGARAATAYGLAIAHRLAADLSRLGFTIVSGLARGIDAAAHTGALEAGGATIAVLPGGLDHVTPTAHARLAAAIAAQGALASERADGVSIAHRGEFIRRNRLIAALARATVVVEAAETSGALATARVARRLGREVLAVPGDIDRDSSRGTLALLREGARPCADAGDVLRAIGTSEPSRASTPSASHGDAPAVAPTPAGLLAAMLDPIARTIDVLAARSGIAPSLVSALLLELEWAGVAKRAPGGRWRRAAP